MGNLCSSGSERADNKEEKRVPEKLKDGEDEALLPKSGEGVGLVAREGSGDDSGRVGSAGVTSKVLENGQCVMPGGRSVCPEIVVSSSDVEPVGEDDDDDDFLKSVIAVVEDTTGRAVTSARDVVAEIEARNLPRSDYAVVSFPEAASHGEGSVRDSVSADYSALGKSSRESVGAESTNWADSVLMSATTAAQSAFSDGSSFATKDFSSDFTLKEDSPSMSVLGENSNNIVALSSTGRDTVDEVTVSGNSVETGPLSGENSQHGTDSVSDISTRAEHRVENVLIDSHGLNNDTAGSSESQLSGGGGSSVDGLVAEDETCEQCVVGEALGHQDSPDLASADRTKPVSPGEETGAHDDGLGTSVDAQVDFRNTSQQEYDQNNRDEESIQGKEFKCEDVPSTLEAAVGHPASEVSGQLEKTAGSCADTAGKGTASTFIKDDMAVDSNSRESFKGNNILPWAFSSQENETSVDSVQQCDGEMTAKTEAASSRTQHEQSVAAVVGDENSVVAVVNEEAENENQEMKPLEGTSGASFCPPTLSLHTSEAEMGILDKSTLPQEDDIFAGWSIVSDTDILKDVNSDDGSNHEAVARDIVESIISRASLIVSEGEQVKGLEDSFLSFVDREESIFEDQRPDALLPFLTDRFASPPQLSPSPSLDTDQCKPAGAESNSSSISQGDLIETYELLIPPVSPLNVLGESRSSDIFDSSDEDREDASIKQTAWSITDRAVKEAVKIVAENGCYLNDDFNQPHNNDLDLYPSENASVHDECNNELPETSLNNNTESPTHMNGVNCLPEYSTQTGLTSNHQQSAPPEITPAEETLAQSTSHSNKPPENDLVGIPDNSSHASPLIPSDTELISTSSPPTSNGEHGDSDNNTETFPLYFSKVPSCLPPLDNDSLPGKPVIIINSPDSAANTGSNEDISVHTEALI